MEELALEQNEQLLEQRRLRRLEQKRRRKMQQRMVLGLLAFSVMFVCRKGLAQLNRRFAKGIFPPRRKKN